VGGLLALGSTLPRGVFPTVSAQTGAAAPLRMWWWGEQEAPGIVRWIQSAWSGFQAETGVAIEPTELDIDTVLERFVSAAAAGDVPDIQYLWNGTYHMEWVWNGLIAPLNGLVGRDVLRRAGATVLSTFEGNQYRVGFYNYGFGVVYNKALFDRAGLDADAPPQTWDQFLNTCDRLKAAGITPFAGGSKDGYWGDWYLNHTLTQQLDSPAEALSLFIGNLDWREPKYHRHWVLLDELTRLGIFNSDIDEWPLFRTLELFGGGQAAMCLSESCALPDAQRRLGRENIGFMVMPVFGRGKMAGLPLTDAEGFGIPAQARNPRLAAQFLEFMHRKDQVQAMWTLSGQIPADEAFDSSIIDDPLLKTVHERWVAGPHNLYPGNMMPTDFWFDVMLVTSRSILTGQMTGEQAADLAHSVTEQWRTAHPEAVDNYNKWGRGLGL
jgi:multiple sugar transport system substrate-binding protein